MTESAAPRELRLVRGGRYRNAAGGELLLIELLTSATTGKYGIAHLSTFVSGGLWIAEDSDELLGTTQHLVTREGLLSCGYSLISERGRCGMTDPTPALDIPDLELPEDFHETMAELRVVAELARAELRSGARLGPAMRRHITDGGGHPDVTLMVVDLLDNLAAAHPVNKEAAESVRLFTEKATAFVEKVKAFIDQRPEYITAINNAHPDNHSDVDRWRGNAEGRRQLAESLGWTVPHNPGEVTGPKPQGESETP